LRKRRGKKTPPPYLLNAVKVLGGVEGGVLRERRLIHLLSSTWNSVLQEKGGRKAEQKRKETWTLLHK